VRVLAYQVKMLKKINRLRVARHFKRAYEKGQSISGRFVKIRAFHNFHTPKAPAKIAVVISKKVFSRSVDRNLWRRRAKSIMQGLIGPLNGWEIVINFNGAIKTADFPALKEDLTKCLEKLQSH